jgi:N4-gp56 family major capsid protein
MTAHAYTTAAARIGAFKGEILKHAVPREVLGITGTQHKMPENVSDTVIYRRWLPYGGAATNATTINTWSVTATAHEIQEGVTPSADTIAPQNITVYLKQYGALYMYTDKVARLYEDDVPSEMKKQTGERMGLLREKIRYGALQGCTNKFYAGGTSRATVDEPVSLNLLRRISRNLMANRGDLVTQILKASADYATAPIEAAFLVFVHTDAENDIRELPGFKTVAEYGQRKPVHQMELGSVDRFRFIVSPELSSIADAGASVGSTSLYSTTGSSIDVYPMIVVAEDAWGDVALRGLNSFTADHIPHSQKTKDDPMGQRGYVSASFWSASFVQNDGWMAVAEIGIRALT